MKSWLLTKQFLRQRSSVGSKVFSYRLRKQDWVHFCMVEPAFCMSWRFWSSAEITPMLYIDIYFLNNKIIG